MAASVAYSPLTDQRDVVPYLLRRELVSAESIIAGDLVVEDISRRNRNFRVTCREGRSYLLKQALTDAGVAAIAYEAEFYRALNQDADMTLMRPYVPRVHEYDVDAGVLVLELVLEATDLRQYHSNTGRFSLTLAKLLGAAIGHLHADGERLANGDCAGRFKTDLPWVLSSQKVTADDLVTSSPASLQVSKLVQSAPRLGFHLQRLKAGWAAETLIHHDLKWDNCLASCQPGSRRHDRLAIIDWEAAGVGDSCWDVGSVFNDYLAFWVLSMPLTAEASLSQLPQMARYPLHVMHPALRSFWNAYISARDITPQEAPDVLVGSVEYAAARLVQTGFEQMQMRSELTGNVVAIAQLAENILERPREAATVLLGFGSTEGIDGD